jgi:pyruvate/2-oxoglutarate dehydrogenase complex dihydrolipoamide acyltransferase (E2) component
MILLLIAAIFLPWQQTSRGEGQVVARLPQFRLQPVESPAKGIIDSLKDDLREGSEVEKGEVIMVIKPFAEDAERLLKTSVEAQEKKLEYYTQIRDASLQQVESIKLQTEQEVRGAESEVAAARSAHDKALREVEAQDAKYAQAKVRFKSVQGLAVDVIAEVDYMDLKNKENEEFKKLESLHASAEKAVNDINVKQRALEEKTEFARYKVREAQQKVDKANTDINTTQKELQDLYTKRGEFDRLEVKSPSTGFIQAIRGQAGTKAVKEGDLLFEVVPKTDDLAVELTVRGVDTPLIEVDDPVRLQFEGWPAIQFVGWPSVAVGTFPGKVIAINPTDSGKGIFKIIVGPDNDSKAENSSQDGADRAENGWPGSRYLRQGVRANGWVILNQVPLGFEIWRQMNGFPITISDSEPTSGKSGEKDTKMPKMK